MAKKKRKPKKLSAPVGKPEIAASKRSKIIAKIFRPRVLSTFAFGISGLLAGLATGLNHFPNTDAMASVSKMMLLAAYLGDPHVDVAAGLVTAVSGLIMGACLGFSALSEPKDVGMSLLFSIILSTAAILFTGSVFVAALGFLVGHTPAVLGYMKLRAA